MNQTPAQREQRIRDREHPLLRILELVRVLRGPGGCPWDQEQTLKSMTPYLQEEAYEVTEAISTGNPDDYQEELGDLLFLVLFMAEAGKDGGQGGIDEAADSVVEKLIRRHPHVFQDTPDLGAEGALKQWEELKQEETTTDEERSSSLGHRPKGLPALTTAFRISEKAGAVGFEWPTLHQALGKIEEELAELKEEIAAAGDGAGESERVEEELGDLLYSVANVGRYLKVDPERALRTTIRKFTDRFRAMEKELWSRGKTPSTSTLKEMEQIWNRARSARNRAPHKNG